MLENQLREIGRQRDYTDEGSFRALLERLTKGVPVSEFSLASAGTRVGNYELLQQVGRGGMGVVFRARQVSLNRQVAVKMIHSAMLAGPEEISRFRREAEATAQLHHPGIVPIFEVGEADGHCFYSMPFIEGQSLAERIAQGPLTPRHAAHIALRVAQAIGYAHSRGIIHRDLKPANILLPAEDDSASVPASPEDPQRSGSRGTITASHLQPKITDFGLAKQLDANTQFTATGQILGTPGFMPPEQALGQTDVGPAADVYGVGASLYAALTGRPPFQAATKLETIQQLLVEEPASLRRLNAAIDRDLETICLKCLHKKPLQRYQNAAALADDLQRFLDGRPIVARPVNGLERAWRWCRRRPTVAAAAAAGLVVVILLIVLAAGASHLRLSRERAKHLEREAVLHVVQLEAAQQVVQSQQLAATTRQYFALVSQVRERAVLRQPGWAFQGWEDVRQATKLNTDSVDAFELRNEAAQCLAGIDLRPVTEIPVPAGYEPHMLAFHPDGNELAIATLGSDTELCVIVCQIPSGEVRYELRVPVPESIEFDGIRLCTYLSGGRELVIATRSGWLHRWNLGDSEPQRHSVPIPSQESRPLIVDGARERAWYQAGGTLQLWEGLANGPAQELFPCKIDGLQFSPDGRWLALCGRNIEIVDTRTRSLAQVLAGLSRITAFSPDGRLLAGIDDQISLVDLQDGEIVRTMADPATGNVHDDTVSDVSFSPSGSLVMSSGFDQKFKLWDPASGQLLLSTFVAGADEVRAVFSPDERFVAATANDRVILYELSGPAVFTTVAVQADPIRAFDVSLDPAVLVCAAGERSDRHARISLWDLDRNRLIDAWRIPGLVGSGCSVAVLDDASRLAACTHERSQVVTWGFRPEQGDSQSPTKPPALPAADVWPTTARGEPAPRLPFQGDRYWRVIGRNTVLESRTIRSLGLPWDRVDAALNWGDGRAFFFHQDEFCEFDILANHLAPGEPRKIMDHWPDLWDGGIDAAVSCGDGTALFFRGHELKTVSLASRKVLGTKTITAYFKKTGFHADINAAMLDRASDGSVRLLKDDQSLVYTGKIPAARPETIAEIFPGIDPQASVDAAVDLGQRSTLHHRWTTFARSGRIKNPSALTLSSDGNRLWTVSDTLDVTGWSLPDLSEQFRWNNRYMANLVGMGAITGVDAGHRWMLLGVKSGTMNLFDIATGRLDAEIPVPGRPSTVALNHEESLAVCGTQDGMVLIASTEDGTVRASLDAHHDVVTAAAFTPDDELLATASTDKTIRFWQRDGDMYRLVLIWSLPTAVQQIKFSSDNARLIVLLRSESALRICHLDPLRLRLAELGLDW